MTELDLAVAMDCTGSMGSYISSVQENLKAILKSLVESEKCNLRFALVEYRDHPPQDSSFVTRTHDFTTSHDEAQDFINGAKAQGGGDEPEAVTDAMNDMLNLTWRDTATKVCLLIADAPPHGLISQPCPCKRDIVQIIREMAHRGITLYCLGCVPSASPYQSWFTAVAHITGGQYLPLSCANQLTSVLIGSVREEVSLEKMMAQVHAEVLREAAERGGVVDEHELTRRIQELLSKQDTACHKVDLRGAEIPSVTTEIEEMAKLETMPEMKSMWEGLKSKGLAATPSAFVFGSPVPGTGLFGSSAFGCTPAMSPRKKPAVRRTAPKKAAPRVTKKPAISASAPVPKPSRPTKRKAEVAPPVAGKRRSLRLLFSRSGFATTASPSAAPKSAKKTVRKPQRKLPNKKAPKRLIIKAFTTSPKRRTPMKPRASSSSSDEESEGSVSAPRTRFASSAAPTRGGVDSAQARRLVRKAVARNNLASR